VWQLIGAVEVVGQRQARIGSEHVCAEVDLERLQGAAWDRRGRDREARPGEHRRGNQEDVEVLPGMSDDAGFGICFDDVGKIVVRHRMRVEQTVERTAEVILRAILEQSFTSSNQTTLPELVFHLAAGLGKPDRQAAQLGRVGRDAFPGREAVTFHVRAPAERSIRHCTKLTALALARLHLLLDKRPFAGRCHPTMTTGDERPVRDDAAARSLVNWPDAL
jgi:hypothetical protein